MSTDKPESLSINGEGLRVGIVASRYNMRYVNALLQSVLETLSASGVEEGDIETFRVPGANEIPYVVSMLSQIGHVDVVLALGLIIRGDTDHHTILGQSTANALLDVSTASGIPVINGILTVENEEQAIARITGEQARGTEFAAAVLEMAQLKHALHEKLDFFGFALDPDEHDWLDDLDLEEADDTEDDWRK
jgi:6,7-dimethyl-8-ribityllumazine synthase